MGGLDDRRGPRDRQLAAVGVLAGIRASTASSSACCGTPAKKAAKPQNSSRFHLANGWLWHWAHSRRMPEEGPGRVGGERLGLAPLGRVEGGGRRLGPGRGHARSSVAAGELGGEDLADDPVIARLLGDLLAQPGFEAGRGDRRLVLGRPRAGGAAARARWPARRRPGCRAGGRPGPARFSGSGSSRKSRASAAVGILPTRSRLARRRNSPSSARADGLDLRLGPARGQHPVDRRRQGRAGRSGALPRGVGAACGRGAGARSVKTARPGRGDRSRADDHARRRSAPRLRSFMTGVDRGPPAGPRIGPESVSTLSAPDPGPGLSPGLASLKPPEGPITWHSILGRIAG